MERVKLLIFLNLITKLSQLLIDLRLCQTPVTYQHEQSRVTNSRLLFVYSYAAVSAPKRFLQKTDTTEEHPITCVTTDKVHTHIWQGNKKNNLCLM